MCDKMAISAYILKIVEKDPFLRLQVRAKEMFNQYMFNPPGTKGFGTHTKHQGGSKRTPQYLKNEKCYKPETFGGVRSIL